jgi:hypothetical protein
MMTRPLSSVVSVTPGGSDGICIAEARVEKVVSLIKQNRTGRILGNALWAIQFGLGISSQLSSNTDYGLQMVHDLPQPGLLPKEKENRSPSF